MTPHRRLVIAQKIAREGILSALTWKAERGLLLDMAEADRDEIIHMVKYIAHSTRHMYFTEGLERLTFGNIYLECSSMSREGGDHERDPANL